MKVLTTFAANGHAGLLFVALLDLWCDRLSMVGIHPTHRESFAAALPKAAIAPLVGAAPSQVVVDAPHG